MNSFSTYNATHVNLFFIMYIFSCCLCERSMVNVVNSLHNLLSFFGKCISSLVKLNELNYFCKIVVECDIKFYFQKLLIFLKAFFNSDNNNDLLCKI